MRKLINKYAYVIIGAAVVLAVLLLIFRGGNKPAHEMTKYAKAFYVDEETGEEFVRPVDQLPPLMGPSGRPTLVRAYKFSADGGTTAPVVYLEKYPDEVLDELKTSTDDARKSDLLSQGLYIRLPSDGSKWLPKNSPEAQRAIASAMATIRSGSQSVEPVYPK